MGCNNIRRPWGGCWAHGMETLQGSLHVTLPHSSQTILLPFITVTTRSNEFLKNISDTFKNHLFNQNSLLESTILN